MKIYKCLKCGKLVLMLNENDNETFCCDQEMVELKSRQVDASLEKHVPVISKNDNVILIRVGEVEHPMTMEHYIEFVVLETNGGQRIKKFNPGDKPEASFIINEDEKVLNVYTYCNLHGLWNSDN